MCPIMRLYCGDDGRSIAGMAGEKKSAKDRRRFGPYSRKLQRGAIGDLVDGRSAQGRFIRHLEAELIAHVGGQPTIAQKLLIDRIIRLCLQLDAFDEKLASGNWAAHDARTYAGVLGAHRLALRDLSAMKPSKAQHSAMDAIEYMRQHDARRATGSAA